MVVRDHKKTLSNNLFQRKIKQFTKFISIFANQKTNIREGTQREHLIN